MNQKNITLRDIAERTGYSINTVSHALRNISDISDAAKKIICDAAEEMGYIANSAASSLRSGRSGIIAVIISDISNPLFGIEIKEIERALAKYQYVTIILNTNENEETETKALHSAISKGVDGILICPAQKSLKNIIFMEESGIPFVLMGRYFPGHDTDYVVWNDVQGAYQATEYLISRGNQKILYIHPQRYISSAQERLDGYKAALKDHKIPFQEEYSIEMNDFNSITELEKLIEKAPAFDAVFAFNDMMAWALVTILKRKGMDVPGDVDLIGFDNIQSRFQMPFPIPSVHTPKGPLVQAVVDILMHKIESGKSEINIHKVIDTSLCLRTDMLENKYNQEQQ